MIKARHAHVHARKTFSLPSGLSRANGNCLSTYDFGSYYALIILFRVIVEKSFGVRYCSIEAIDGQEPFL